MAVLTSDQLTEVRGKLATDQGAVAWDKTTANAAIQAVETWFEATGRAAINSAINTTVGASTFTAAQKTAIVKFWLKQKFDRGG